MQLNLYKNSFFLLLLNINFVNRKYSRNTQKKIRKRSQKFRKQKKNTLTINERAYFSSSIDNQRFVFDIH